jgi:hypothetical protein
MPIRVSGGTVSRLGVFGVGVGRDCGGAALSGLKLTHFRLWIFLSDQ